MAGNLGISDLIEEFFVGITHDKNMARMASFFEKNSVNLEADAPDFFKQFGLTQENNLNDFYSKVKFNENDLVFPIFTNYKLVSLD